MIHKSIRLPFAFAMLALAGSVTAIDAFPQPALAQTVGMDRRHDRRATRQGARELKHDCNASGQATRADCRHAKHGMKEEGREHRW